MRLACIVALHQGRSLIVHGTYGTVADIRMLASDRKADGYDFEGERVVRLPRRFARRTKRFETAVFEARMRDRPMTRVATVLAALAAADLAEEHGDLEKAAELLRQVEREVAPAPTSLAFQAVPEPRRSLSPSSRYAYAVDAYTRRLSEPRSRRRA